MSDARLQHELDLRTRECQEWKTRATSAEVERDALSARVLALNLEKMELHARLDAAILLLEKARIFAYSLRGSYGQTKCSCIGRGTCMHARARDLLEQIDAATKAG